jgi:hypothetical protein
VIDFAFDYQGNTTIVKTDGAEHGRSAWMRVGCYFVSVRSGLTGQIDGPFRIRLR